MLLSFSLAGVVKLANTLRSGRSSCKGLEVQVLSPALANLSIGTRSFPAPQCVHCGAGRAVLRSRKGLEVQVLSRPHESSNEARGLEREEGVGERCCLPEEETFKTDGF